MLEEANIAWFGACCPLVAQEFTSEISYVLGSLLPGMGAGLGWKMAQDGCENPVNVVIDIPAGDVAYPALQAAYEVGGGEPGAWRMVKIPAVPGDYSAQVADATNGSDCIAGGISDSNWAAWLPAMAAAGADQRLYGLQGNLNGVIAEQFPELTEGAIISGSYPNISGPMWDDYHAALEEYDAPDLDWNSLAGLGTWAALTAFTTIVEGMDGEIDNNTFIEAANATTALDTGGMIGVLDLTEAVHRLRRDVPAHLQPHRVLRHGPGRQARAVRRPGLRHDGPDRRRADGLTSSPPRSALAGGRARPPASAARPPRSTDSER